MKTACQRAMSFLDYFKRKEGSLPDLRGSLARVIPSSAIAATNSEVEKSVCPKVTKKLKKKVYSPREQAQMGKLACTIGATAAAKGLSRKVEEKINESTVRGFKKAYIAERSAKRLREEDLSVSCSLRRKAGHCFLGKSLIMLYKSTS